MAEWERDITVAQHINWMAAMRISASRVPDAIYQTIVFQCADWDKDTGWSPIRVEAAGTSDYFEIDPENPPVKPSPENDNKGAGAAYDANPVMLQNNEDFADLIKRTFELERQRRGVAPNEFVAMGQVHSAVGFARVPPQGSEEE